MNEIAYDIEVPGGVLACREAGRGASVVLIHGAAQNLHVWEPIAARLAGSARVIRYDLRGHGQSAPLREPSFAIHTEDLDRLLASRGLVDPTVVGFSLGGYIGLRWAAAATGGRFVSVEGPLASYAELSRRLGRVADFAALRAEFEAEAFLGTAADAEGCIAHTAALDGVPKEWVRRSFRWRTDGKRSEERRVGKECR